MAPSNHITPSRAFGKRLKAWRKYLNLTQDSAARECGIGAGTFCRMEHGDAPDIFTLARLCRWMGVSADKALEELGAHQGHTRLG